MEKSAIEKLRDAKKEHEVALVSFFNNGKVRKDENYMVKHMNKPDSKHEFDGIMNVFCNITDSYARHYDFDDVKMGLEIGLIFRAEDVQGESIKEDAQPVKGVVRYYTGKIDTFKDGKQANDIDYSEILMGRQSFVDFNGLVAQIKKSGLQYTGPETFEEFEEQILVGEPFEISLSANLNEKQDQSSTQQTRQFRK